MRFSVERLAIPDVLLVKPVRHSDARGYVMECYRAEAFADIGIGTVFVQDNQAMSTDSGTIRGLHFQRAPHAQAKLVRVIRGAIFDVAVDLRKTAPTYGRWVGVRLTAEGAEQVYVPKGFAHGYCTLEPRTEVLYKCDDYYAPECEGGLHFADPHLGIEWPITADKAFLSDKDRALPSFVDFT